jgi:hypothetical protein
MNRRSQLAVATSAELLSEEDVARGVEPEDGEDPRSRRDDREDRDREPERIEPAPADRLPRGIEAQRERDYSPECRHDVDRLRVEVVLIDYARPCRYGAESRRDHGCPHRASSAKPVGRQPRDRDRGERYGIVEKNEETAGAVPNALVRCRARWRAGASR